MITRSVAILLMLTICAGCGDARRDVDGTGADVDVATTGYGDVDLQGHRGARGLLPENTIPGFEKALELGMQTVEIDVVVSADSHLVVSHEPWFSHEICSTPNGEPIAEEDARSFRFLQMTYDEIRRYDCGLRGNPRFPEQQPRAAHKPRLDSAIVALESYAEGLDLPAPRYNIEIKSRPEFDGVFTPEPARFARLVHRVIERHDIKDRTTVQSFDPRSLQAMRDLDGDVTLALLVDNDLGLERNLEQLGFTPEIYSPHQRLVDSELVEAVHEKGVDVVPWTVNDPGEMRRFLELGVDGLITDYPDRAAALR